MVICDTCKVKVADSAIESYENLRCETCEGDTCEACLIKLESGTYCKICVPTCSSCKTKLSSKTVACETCEEEVHKTCAVSVSYDEMPERGYNVYNKHSHLLKQGKAVSGWLCKPHATVFEEYKADCNIMVEYAAKIFKAIGLPPLGIVRHISPEEAADRSESFAQLILKNDWKAILTHAGAGFINVTFRGFNFDTTIKVSTYNHEAAVNTVRDKLIKLLLHHKRNIQNNKRGLNEEYGIDIEGRFQEILRGYADITDKETAFKALNGVTDMLRILTASKNDNIQE